MADPRDSGTGSVRWGGTGRLHPDGWRLIGAAAALALLLSALADGLGWLGVLAAVWVAAGFRVARRATPPAEGAIAAPLDGRVVLVEPGVPPASLGLGVGPVTRVRLAPGPLDSRVVLAPAAGTVAGAAPDGPEPRLWPALLVRGAGMTAARVLDAGDGRPVGLVLRSASWAPGVRLDGEPGDALVPGRPIGTLRLAGAVDVYLPPGTRARVVEGQRTVAGETALAAPGDPG